MLYTSSLNRLSSTTSDNLLPLDALLLHAQTDKKCNTTRRDRQYKRRNNRIVIALEHTWQQFRRHHLPQIRRTCVRHNTAIKSRRILWNLFSQRVNEDILCDGNRQSATEGIEKHDAGIGGRHVFFVCNDLHRDKGDLNTSSCADTGEDLVADPLTRGGANFECVQHAGTDGKDGAAEPHEGCVPSDGGDEATDDNGRAGDADKVGNGADTGLFGCGALDGLEVEGEVEDMSAPC